MEYASVFHIEQGIKYLRGIKDDDGNGNGNCTVGPGPGNCTRVSCSYNSGIWFCNDNPTEPATVPCRSLGDLAWDILVKCYDYADTPHDSVHGQNFDPGNWNVIVQGTRC
ncbi:hypothetical protein GGS20DRAFT_530764 [Poronia punctata]|nr:hypothetical protein GGS20DRAFT_530764 [Poronia punctata]